MKKAAFLDRDGVINEDVGHLNNTESFRLLPGAAAAIKKLNESGYCVIVITNQGAIAKGFLTIEILEGIHAKMRAQLAEKGAYIDRVYYCPHHPEGIVAEYSIACDCRKPATNMFKEAIADFNIDVTNSFLVGDKSSDILAGSRIGLRTVLLPGVRAASDIQYEVQPDFIADDLMGAIAYFL